MTLILIFLVSFFAVTSATYYSLVSQVKRTNDILLSQNALLEKTSVESYQKMNLLEKKIEVLQNNNNFSDTLLIALIAGTSLILVSGIIFILFSNSSVNVVKIVETAGFEQNKNMIDYIKESNIELTKTILDTGQKSFENEQQIIEKITEFVTKADTTEIVKIRFL